MKGLRRRVSAGFLSIAVLLFISGVIAFFELNTLSGDTKSILNENKRKMELSRAMLEAAQQQSDAFVMMTLFDDASSDAICLDAIEELEATLDVAYDEVSSREILDTLSMKLIELKLLTHTVIDMPKFDTIAMENRDEYYQLYRPIHLDIISSIYDLTSASLLSVEPRAEQLQRNAYRAVTPVLISLIVMIVIVLLLYYFMIIYCVNPIVRLNRSLSDFLNFRLPFKSKDDCNDEVKELQESIEKVTLQLKREQKRQ